MPKISKNKSRSLRANSCKRKAFDSDVEMESDDLFTPNFTESNHENYFYLKDYEEILYKLCEILIYISNNKRIVSILIYLLLRYIEFKKKHFLIFC